MPHLSSPIEGQRPPRFDRVAVLAEGHLEPESAKTAVGMLRYGRSEVVAVIDSTHAGSTSQQVLGVGGQVPVVATIEEAIALRPACLVIGIAPRGGSLPDRWRRILRQALHAGLDIVSGLHTFLSNDPELSALAAENEAVLADVRKPPSSLPVSGGRCRYLSANTVLTVGTDCSIGKMSSSLELVAEARRRGIKTEFVPTGQTGIMIWGRGISVDACIGDFIAGAVEQEVLAVADGADWVFVEGQGSLYHPGYSGVTMGLIHGCMPKQMVLCHQPSRSHLRSYKIRIPRLSKVVKYHEQVFSPLFPTRVAAIALNTRDLSESEARSAIEDAEADTGLVADDCVRFGATRVLDALLKSRRDQPSATR